MECVWLFLGSIQNAWKSCNLTIVCFILLSIFFPTHSIYYVFLSSNVYLVGLIWFIFIFYLCFSFKMDVGSSSTILLHYPSVDEVITPKTWMPFADLNEAGKSYIGPAKHVGFKKRFNS